MTKNSFSIKTLLLSIILILSFVFLQNSWFFASIINNGSGKSVDASTDALSSQDVTSSLGLQNPNFTETSSSSSYPQTPSNWVVWDDTVKSEPNKKGVINLSSEVYNLQYKNYGLEGYTQPPLQGSSSEQSVLMINAGENARNYGYATNNTVSLSSNSFYSVSLYVYTNTSSTASVYLTGADFDELNSAKITNINTFSTWQQVVFYIATGTNSTSSLGIQLFLGEKSSVGGSTGFVLFDNIKITRYSGDAFNSVLETGAKSSLIDLRPTYLSSGNGVIANADFSAKLDNWTHNTTAKYIDDFNTQQLINGDNVVIGDNQRGDTSGVLLTAKDGYAAITSSEFSVERQGLYRITFWAKGEITSGSVNFTLSSEQPDPALPEDEKSEKLTQTISNLSTSASNFDNGWAMYAFYIVGNPLFDASKVTLTLGIGSESANATGYVAISNIRSEKVTTAEKTSASADNTNSATFYIHNNTSLSFKNGAFNYVEINDVNSTSPLAPLDWTKQNDKANDSGVVNIKSTNWTLDIDRPTNNGDYSNNVLMVRNDYISNSTAYQGYTSSTETLSSDGYAEITVKAFTRSISNNGYAFITITNEDDVILNQIKLKSTNSWQTYKIYLHNYMTAQTIKLSLSLGNENTPTTGVAFFDDCIIDTSLTEENFNAVTENSTNLVVDLGKDSLTANDNGTPYFWEANNASETQEATGGITHINSYSPGNPTAPNEDISEVMYIQAFDPAYYYFANKLGYTFSSGTYYKISVLVRTVDITPDVEGEFDEGGNQVTHGAFISIDGVDAKFTSINTAPKNTNNKFDEITNKWTEYTIYLNPSSELNGVIKLGLGQSTMQTTGYAFFANLNVSSLTEDEYKSETATLDTENLPSNILIATTTTDDEEENSGNTYNEIDWIAIPTVIIAVAVIVAVVGFYIKKVYRARPRKSTTVNTDYDRLQTLLKDVDRRERKTAIKHKIDLLHDELKQSQDFLKQETEELEKQTNAYNTAKEIAQDNPNVELELPDIKQMQKSIEIQEEKIEEIELDIRILEDEYNRITESAKKDLNRSPKKPVNNIKKRK